MIQPTLKVLHVYRVRLLLLVRASARYRGHLSGYACVLVFAPGCKTCPSHDTTLHEMIFGSVLHNALHLLCQLHSVQVTICIT